MCIKTFGVIKLWRQMLFILKAYLYKIHVKNALKHRFYSRI
jgi:hypothetical protein